jgi:hypothetical protein
MNYAADSSDPRRYPALLLVPCLLLMGVLATAAPVRDAPADSVTVRVQIARTPALRPVVVPQLASAALPALAPVRFAETVIRTTAPRIQRQIGPRQKPTPAHPSRAPPASP